MSATVQVELDGQGRIGAAARALSERIGARGRRALLLGIGAKMKEQANRTFIARRDPVTGAPWAPTRRGGRPLFDRGLLLGSILGKPPQIVGQDAVAISATRDGATAHQYGATIKPRDSKFLAIPLTPEARRAGRARRWWERQSGRAQKPFIYTAQSGKKFIAIAKGSGARRKLALHWLLLDEVSIPRRRFLGMGAAYRNEMESFVAEFAAKALAEAARGGTP